MGVKGETTATIGSLLHRDGNMIRLPMTNSVSRWLAAVALWMVLTASFMLGFQKIAESDTFWHLKTGEWITQHRTIPRADPFVSAGEPQAWMDWEWLFQVGAYLVYAASGFTGLVTVKAVMVAGVALVLMAACRQSGAGVWLSAFTVLTAMAAARDRLELRPDTMMFLFAAVMVLTLEQGRRGRHLWLAGAPIVQVLWVNSHPSFPLGVCLAGAYFTGEIIQTVIRRAGRKEVTIERTRIWAWMTGTTVVVALMSLVNPYGMHLIHHVIEQMQPSGPVGVIGEWQPTREALLTEPNLALTLFWFMWWLTPVAMLGRWAVEGHRFPWAHVVVGAGLALLGLRAQRFTALYALVSAPILAGALGVIGSWMGDRLSAITRVFFNRAGRVVTVAAAGLLIWATVSDRWAWSENRPARFGAGVDELTVPVRAVDALMRLPAGAGLFNTYLSGGYLIWRLYPDWEVANRWAFADSRANLFGRDYLDHYLSAMRNPSKWESWMRDKNVSVIFMQYGTADDTVLMQYLATSEDWRLYYFDHAACVYVRASSWQTWLDAGRMPELVAPVAIGDRPTVESYAHTLADQLARTPHERGRILATIGNFLLVSGATDTALALFDAALEVNPRISEAWMNKAVVALQRGKWNDAMTLTDQLLTHNARYYPAWLMQAQIRMNLGDFDRARRSAERALEIAPRSAQSHVVRAQIAVVENQPAVAIAHLQRAVAEKAGDADVHWFLARLLAREGRKHEAILAYRDVLRLWVGTADQRARIEGELLQLTGSDGASRPQ